MGKLADAVGSSQRRTRLGGVQVPVPTPEPSDVLDAAVNAVGNRSATGFLGNLLGDFGELAQGAGTLMFHTVKDVGGEAASLLSEAPGIPDYEHSSTIDEIAKALPGAVVSDLSRRYGPLLPGGTPAGEAASAAYEDPLSYVMDALMVASAGGTAAARGAQGASKLPGVADDLSRLAGGADDVGRTARLVDALLPGAKDRAMGKQVPLGGTRTKLYETPGARARPVEVDRPFNPVTRAFQEKVVDRAMTRPLKKLEAERTSMLDRLQKGDLSTPEEIDLQLLNETINFAQANNISRVTKPFISSKRFGRLMDSMLGESKSHHVAKRDAQMQQWHDIFAQLPDEAVDDFHLVMQVGTPEMPGPRLGFDDIEARLASLPETPQAERLRTVLEPHVEGIRTMMANGADPREIEAARRVIEAVAEPLSYLGDDTIPVAVKVMDDARLANFESEANAFLDAGGSYETLLARQYLPMRVAEKRSQKLRSFEDATDPFVLDDAVKATGKKAPVYYPHYETLTQKNSNWLLSTNLYKARQQAQASRFKKSQGVAFENHLKGIKDAYDTNPAEAYSRASAEILKHTEMEDWLERVAIELGRPVSARDEVGSGEVVMNLDGVRMMIRNRRTTMEALHDNLADGLDENDAFANAIEATFQNLDEMTAEAASQRGALVAIPKSAADKIQRQGKLYFNNAGLRLFWDGPVNAWRNLTLYLRPAYYVNNVFGNTAFLKLQGGKLGSVLRQMDKRYRKAVRDAIPDEMLPDVESGFHSKVGQRATHLGKAEQTVTGQVVKGVKESKVGRATGRARDMAQRFNQYLENAYRRESFLTAVEKQASKRGVKLAGNSWIRSHKRLDDIMEAGADPQIARRALDEMNRTMNNYNALSPFEQHIIRRFAAPFWPFYRHAATTLFRMPFDHPFKAAGLNWIHEVSQSMDTLGPRPEWMKDFQHVGPGDQPGEERFASTSGANPFANVIESPASLLNPFIQTGMEQVTGRDTFTGRQFTSEGVYNDPITGQQFVMGPDGQAVPAERRAGGMLAPVAPSLSESLLGLLPFTDTVRDIAGGGARYSATGEVIEDEVGNVKYPTDPLQELLKLTGVSTLDYNLQNYQDQLRGASQRATSALLKRLANP